MKLLDAVNLILPKLGEHPVTSLTLKHPTLAIILPEVDQELKSLLMRGWWFNQFEYKAIPDVDGKIALGTATLSFVPYSAYAAVRGKELYNVDTMSYVWTDPVEGLLTQYIDFEELPETAAQVVWYNALINAFTTDIGMSNELQIWQVRAGTAASDLMAEHLRNRKYNTKKTRRFRNLRCALRG